MMTLCVTPHSCSNKVQPFASMPVNKNYIMPGEEQRFRIQGCSGAVWRSHFSLQRLWKLCGTHGNWVEAVVLHWDGYIWHNKAQSTRLNKEGTQKILARTHPRRHSSNIVAYVPPEMSKININGIKTLPQDFHLGANLTGNVVQVSRNSQPFFLHPTPPNFSTIHWISASSFSPVWSITAKQRCGSNDHIPWCTMEVLLALSWKEAHRFAHDHTDRAISHTFQ